MPSSAGSQPRATPASSAHPAPQPTQAQLAVALADVAARAGATGKFASSTLVDGKVVCVAPRAASTAEYRVYADAGRLWVALVMPDRYLSQSIEQDVVHHGDKLDDLLADELIDLGADGLKPRIEHFRDPAKLFTFRSEFTLPPGKPIEPRQLADGLLVLLLAYEACFVRLGDMDAGDDE